VVVWGERLADGERGRQTLEALIALAGALELEGKPESGLIEVPAGTNGRGLREVGCLPNLEPGLQDAAATGMTIQEIGAAEDLSALLLVHAELPEPALERADSVIAFAGFASDALERHADVVFPAETHAEKEGTLTHPDGRVQRLRQAVGRPADVRAGWWLLAELCGRAGAGVDAPTATAATEAFVGAVPFYGGLTLEEIGARGVRWQDRDAASSLPAAEPSGEPLEEPPALGEGLRVAPVPALFSGPETEHAPPLSFLVAQLRAELSPADAGRLGVQAGDDVILSVNGDSVQAPAAVRSTVTPGSVFLVGGELPVGPVEVRKA
jgi:NADH-quinone oxidoreductase subunit G